MWILTAIFQAIAQAVAWILPISESGHSAIFHDFSGRLTNACSQLTGVIHIGIAIGLIVAFYKLFISLFKNFIGAWLDLFKKRLDIRTPSKARAFMLMSILTFAFYLLYLIPAGKKGNLFMLLHSCSYNGNVLGEGIWFLVTAVLILASTMLVKTNKISLPNIVTAIIIGIVAFVFLPTAGTAFMMCIFFVALLCGMNDKLALRYAVTISVPTLIVTGIIELCIAVTKVNIWSALIAFIISAGVSFVLSKVLIQIVKNKSFTVFSIYNGAIGIICIITGIVEIISKK